MSFHSNTVEPTVRDLRVDFFRGLALWVIFWDHGLQLGRIEFMPFYITPAFTMFSDAAELFVFLSGYVFGLVYMKTLVQEGFAACYRKALRRVGQIYLANALTFFACFGVAYFFYLRHGFLLLELDTLLLEPTKLLPLGLLVYYLPFGFDILPLYMVLLLGMPLLLVLFRWRPWVAVGLSFGIYVLAQVFPALNLPRYTPAYGSNGTWFFNILAWQFIFFLGMALGAYKRMGGSLRLPRRKLLVWAAIIFIAVSPLLRLSGVLFHIEFATLMQAVQSDALYEEIGAIAGMTEEDIYTGNVPDLDFPLTNKRGLGVLRLVHFFAAVYLVVVLLPAQKPFWQGRFASSLCLCGRHSLEVFSATLVLNYGIGVALQYYGGAALVFMLLSTVGLAILTALAWLLEQGKISIRSS